MQYECQVCGWIGTREEMFDNQPLLDISMKTEDEFPASCPIICPGCGWWQDLEDYTISGGSKYVLR